MYFGALSRYRKGWAISFKKLADQFVLLFDQAKNKKVDEHIDIQRQFQNSTTCPNDMIYTLVLGQLINSKYLDDVADQLNEKLQVVGTLSISTLAKDYNLPSEFLSEEIIKRLGKFIEGFQDEHDPKVILTPAYISRYRARIRGVLTGIQINFLFVANVVFRCYHFSKQFLSNLSKIKYLAFFITVINHTQFKSHIYSICTRI